MTHEHDVVVHLEIADVVRQAVADGDHSRVRALLTGSPVLAWFALAPDELHTILETVPTSTSQPSIEFSVLNRMFTPSGQQTDAGPEAEDDVLCRLTDHFQARMRGAPRAALSHMAGMGPTIRTTSALYDTTGGLEGVLAMQTGITMMLAGDLQGALAEFTRLQLNPPRDMPFLLRDAYTKSALIHAQFGDPRLARIALDAAAALPRTDSWTEPGTDAHAQIAELLLLPAGAPDAVARIDAVPLASVGELWPYYVHALQTVYTHGGRRREGTRRIEMLRAAAPPRESGDGFPGSVFETTFAEDALLRGDHAAARLLLRDADPDLFTTRFAYALVDHVAGYSDRTVQTLVSLRKATAGLRRSDIRRLLFLATSLYNRGDVNICVSVLREVRDLYGELSESERLYIPALLWPLVEEHFSGWLARPQGTIRLELPQAETVLTARERDVLACMVRGQSRQQIAATLFVSVNTVKTHQRALFRKLGATNRAEALVEAARRGLT